MRLARFGWTGMALLASLVSAYAAVLLVAPTVGPPFLVARRAVVPWAVVIHLAGGLTALAVGPWQLSARLRHRAINVHRWLGRGYLAAVAVGGVGALGLAPLSQEGFVTHVGFSLLALLWMATTFQAYRRIRAGDEESHRRWMMRSFSLTFAAVTLRIYVPLALVAGVPFHDAYQVISWLCWVPNLIVVDWLVLRAPRRSPLVPDGSPSSAAGRPT